jgi:hypothetical protein
VNLNIKSLIEFLCLEPISRILHQQFISSYT